MRFHSITANVRLGTFGLVVFFFVVGSAATSWSHNNKNSDAITPKDSVIPLYNGKNFDGLTTWLKDSKHEDPRNVFTVEDGILHISGDGYGYVRTNKPYRDYHLIIEFKWGTRTWAERKDCARDSGVLVHCVGPDGGWNRMFMSGIEAQIIEGGMGDFIVVSGVDAKGEPIPVSVTAETEQDRDGELVWKPGGKEARVSGGRINWFGRDPDWEDQLSFRGKSDIDSPLGEWTRMDVICEGSRIAIMVNGVVVNKVFNVSPVAGQILIQTELAEILVRRWELWPLGKAPK